MPTLLQTNSPPRWTRRLLKAIGPGVITGAAGDDPSGIATHSVAGAQLGMKQARAFYALILISTAVGVGLDFAGINPIKALYWTAVINGLLAPFLLVAILVIASDKKLTQGQPSSRLGWSVVAQQSFGSYSGLLQRPWRPAQRRQRTTFFS